MESPSAPPAAARGQRIDAIDLARGVALIAMAIFHLAWDLEFFGYAEPGMTLQFGWKLFARSIAASFLFLVGISLYLAHRDGIRWRPFRIRLLQIAGAAALITLATWFATPDRFIFFGILHQIAVASLLGLAFLRLPAGLLFLAALTVIAAPHFLRAPLFDSPSLWWVGLSTEDPLSNDYVPLFPWFGAVLAGIATGRIAARAGILSRLARRRAGSWARPLRFAGRHGLAFYLLHQPVLIGALSLLALIAPPAIPAGQHALGQSCQRSCEQVREPAACQAYCGCVLERITDQGILDELLTSGSDTHGDELATIASGCQAELGAQP